MSKEEKAKEYAWDMNLGLTGFKKDIAVTKSVQDYLAGYTQAEQDLSTQLTAVKEALREMWSDIHFTDISKMDIMDRIGSLIQPKP